MQNIATAWAPTGPNWVALGNCIGQDQAFFALALAQTLFPERGIYLTAASKGDEHFTWIADTAYHRSFRCPLPKTQLQGDARFDSGLYCEYPSLRHIALPSSVLPGSRFFLRQLRHLLLQVNDDPKARGKCTQGPPMIIITELIFLCRDLLRILKALLLSGK